MERVQEMHHFSQNFSSWLAMAAIAVALLGVTGRASAR